MGILGKIASTVSGGTISEEDAESMIPGLGDAQAQKKANAANIEAADKAMQFSERMSSTAYQRAMEDMKKAGLNPLLAFSQGGASAPSGVSPSIAAESKTGLATAGLAAYSGINTARQQQAQIRNQDIQTESAARLNAAQTVKTEADTAKAVMDTERSRVETQLAKKNMPRAEFEEQMTRKAKGFIDRTLDSLNSTGKEQSRAGEIMNTFQKGLKFMFHPKAQKVNGKYPAQVLPRRIPTKGHY